MTKKLRSGIEIEVAGVSHVLLQKIQTSYLNQNPEPQPPTYEVTTAAGSVETYKHTETSAAETGDEAVKAWNKYVAAHQQWQMDLNERVMNVILMRGIKVDIPDDDEWVAEQKFLGVDVPDDPMERKLHYIMTEVLAGPDDMIDVMVMVMSAGGGIPQEKVTELEGMFRASIQRETDNLPEFAG